MTTRQICFGAQVSKPHAMRAGGVEASGDALDESVAAEALGADAETASLAVDTTDAFEGASLREQAHTKKSTEKRSREHTSRRLPRRDPPLSVRTTGRTFPRDYIDEYASDRARIALPRARSWLLRTGDPT